jgi:hypothetical protein
MHLPRTERTPGDKRISTFFRRNPVAMKVQISEGTDLSIKTIESMVGNRLLTSLNHNHAYLTLKGRVSRGKDRKGFYRHAMADGKVAVFHAKGDAASTLLHIARTTPWGLTQTEAAELLERDCCRPLNGFVEEGSLRRVKLHGIWIYTHPWPKKAALQLNHRRTNERVCPPEPKGVGEKEPVYLEELMDSFRHVLSGVGSVPDRVSKGQLCTILLMTFTDATLRAEELLLRTSDRVRRACGVEPWEVMDHTTMCRLFNSGHLPEAVLEDILRTMVQKLQGMGVVKGRFLVVDATHLLAWYNTSRDTDKHPLPGAAWGEHQGSFFGYKLHLLIDAEAELPVAARLSPGNDYDSPHLMPLVEDFKERYDIGEVTALLADGAYDAGDLRKGVERELRCPLLAPINPRNSGVMKYVKDTITELFKEHGDRIQTVQDALRLLPQKLLTDFGGRPGSKRESRLVLAIKERMHRHLRVPVERVFSRLKRFTGLERPRTRVVERVRRHVLWRLICMVLLAYTAHRVGKPGSALSFASVV